MKTLKTLTLNFVFFHLRQKKPPPYRNLNNAKLILVILHSSLLEELLEWLAKCESRLLNLEAEPLPDDIPTVERLIEEHKEFMEETARRQHEVDSVCKARIQHPPPDRKTSGKRMSTPG